MSKAQVSLPRPKVQVGLHPMPLHPSSPKRTQECPLFQTLTVAALLMST
jgi:hypothetical protein